MTSTHSKNRLTFHATFSTFHDKVSLSKEHQAHTHTQMVSSILFIHNMFTFHNCG